MRVSIITASLKKYVFIINRYINLLFCHMKGSVINILLNNVSIM